MGKNELENLPTRYELTREWLENNWMGRLIYIMDSFGHIARHAFFGWGIFLEGAFKIGKLSVIHGELEKEVTRLEAESTMLRCIAKHNKLNNDWEPDFKNNTQENHSMGYDHELGKIINGYSLDFQDRPTMFYFSDESYEVIKSELGEDLIKTALGVE